jgi:hypothetical protein
MVKTSRRRTSLVEGGLMRGHGSPEAHPQEAKRTLEGRSATSELNAEKVAPRPKLM